MLRDVAFFRWLFNCFDGGLMMIKKLLAGKYVQFFVYVLVLVIYLVNSLGPAIDGNGGGG